MGAAQPEGRVPGPGPAPPAGLPAQPPTVSYPPLPGTAPGQVMQKTPPQSSGAAVFGVIGVAAMLLMVAGSLLPWWKSLLAVQNGWDNDGKYTVFIAALALAFFLVGLIGKSRWPFIVGLVFSLISTAIFFYDIVYNVSRPLISFSNVGYGLIMGAVAGAIGIIAGVGGIAAKRA